MTLVRPAVALSLALSIAAAASAQDAPKNAAAKPEKRAGKGPEALHEEFLKRAKEGDVDVLFLGDSITQGWKGGGKAAWEKSFAPLKAANFGIGGDRTQHVLWRITEGKELEGIDPKLCVLMIGTNNTGSNTAEEIAEGVKAVVTELRKQKPSMKVLLLAVFPRSAKPFKELKASDTKLVKADELHKKIPAINAVIAKLDDGKHVKFLDINAKFLDKDGGLPIEVMYDYLHLTPKGYEAWAEAIEPTVKELLGK